MRWCARISTRRAATCSLTSSAARRCCDAQKHPENYKHLVVRVAGYSALFTTLSRSLQDDIISRTEQNAF